MRVNTNLAAKSIHTQNTGITGNIKKSADKLSFNSVLKTVSDNASCLEMLNKMRSQMRGPDNTDVGTQETAANDKPP